MIIGGEKWAIFAVSIESSVANCLSMLAGLVYFARRWQKFPVLQPGPLMRRSLPDSVAVPAELADRQPKTSPHAAAAAHSSPLLVRLRSRPASRISHRTGRGMDGNRFYVLAGLLPEESDDLEDELDVVAIEGLDELDGDLDEAEIYFPPAAAAGNAVIAAAAGNQVAVAAGNQFVVAAENPLAAQHEDDPLFPWKLVGPRRMARNPDRLPEPDLPTPPEKVTKLEVPWVQTGRTIGEQRACSMGRQSGLTGAPKGEKNGYGFYVHGSMGPGGRLEF